MLNVDGERLALVLRKLVANALQYTPEGGQVTVCAEAAGDRLKVSVMDTGIGMSPEDQAHVGERFWRSEDERVREIKGHGLGLSIAMGMIALMGGEFFFTSERDKGSTFGFTLPAAAPSWKAECAARRSRSDAARREHVLMRENCERQ